MGFAMGHGMEIWGSMGTQWERGKVLWVPGIGNGGLLDLGHGDSHLRGLSS